MNIERSASVTGSVALACLVVSVAFTQVVRPKPVPHDIAGRDNCLMCHARGAMELVKDVPPNHADRANLTCLWCHGKDSPLLTTDPAPILHNLEGRDDCLMCHAPGAMEAVTDTPANHENRESFHCRMCHKPAN